MEDIGHPEDEQYQEKLKRANPERKIIPMPTEVQDPQFKAKFEMAQLSIKIAAEQRKADAEMFQILAEAGR